MQDSTPTPDTSSRSLSLKTHRDREVARREARIGNNQTGGSEHHHRHHHHRQKSPDTSTSGDSDRDRHWRTILGHPPHTPSSSVRSGGNHPRPATEQRRGLPTPLRSPRSRSNATVPGGLPPPVRRRPADGLTDSSGRLPARAQPARPFACDQCVRRFERRGHLKVSLGYFIFIYIFVFEIVVTQFV